MFVVLIDEDTMVISKRMSFDTKVSSAFFILSPQRRFLDLARAPIRFYRNCFVLLAQIPLVAFGQWISGHAMIPQRRAQAVVQLLSVPPKCLAGLPTGWCFALTAVGHGT